MLTGEVTVPFGGGVGGFEDFLAGAIEDLEIEAGDITGIFQAEQVVEAVMVW